MDPDLLAFYESIRDDDQEVYEIVDRVRTLIFNQRTRVTESLHSDRVVFTVDGKYSYFIRPQEEHVAIGFVDDEAIPTLTNYFNDNDRTCRIVKVSTLENVESPGFRAIIKNPIQITNSGRQ